MQNREIQYNIPQDSKFRAQLENDISQWLKSRHIVPPIDFDKLADLSEEFISETKTEGNLTAFVMILINNQLWLPWLSGIPVEKRLLLLPKCLASAKECQGTTDYIGLICNHCNKCAISGIEELAQSLGYITLVAEGSPVVAELIKTGQIAGIVGVSCLEALSKAFEHINNAAIPAVAVPLLDDGCEETTADLEKLKKTLRLGFSPEYRQLDYQQLKELVQSWFNHDKLQTLLNKYNIASYGPTAVNSIDYVSSNGKRYRPFITAAVYETLTENDTFPDSVILTATAIEFFHKASLIHDDIEDNDSERYGHPTLNARFGNAYAINAGDYLIGSGYTTLAAISENPEIKGNIITEIAKAHQLLTIGQGMELENIGKTLPLETVLEIFQAKTSPAFNAALKCGAYLANADNDTLEQLEKIGNALGIAYQIKDDLDDIETDENELSILHCFSNLPETMQKIEAQKLLDHYLKQCRDHLSEIKQPRLKFLLAKIIERIQ